MKSHYIVAIENIPNISYYTNVILLYINMYTFTYINIYMANLR